MAENEAFYCDATSADPVTSPPYRAGKSCTATMEMSAASVTVTQGAADSKGTTADATNGIGTRMQLLWACALALLLHLIG
mmetsp:Transcript_1695/g.2749  ORF Transcript_1695/g.2749 Transcript_1695/m.2749 type:complete len:80 (-) Transcript_1695:32-271(-)